MDTMILKGKPAADALDEETLSIVLSLKEKGVDPCLGLLRIGEKEDDLSYERSLMKRADKLQIRIEHVVLPKNCSQEEAEEAVRRLSADPSVHGILMFLPVPVSLDEKKILECMAPEKDVDGVTSRSQAGLYNGTHIGFPPCTPDGIMRILSFYNIDPAGKHAVVAGRSLVTGKPMAMMLLEKNATVTICHSKTKDLAAMTRAADIIAVCTGHIDTITKEHLGVGQILLDMGINVDDEGHLIGDINKEDALDRALAVTPVPGGAGSVTVSVLFSHVAAAAANYNA